jgi:hypothetical protein
VNVTQGTGNGRGTIKRYQKAPACEDNGGELSLIYDVPEAVWKIEEGYSWQSRSVL